MSLSSSSGEPPERRGLPGNIVVQCKIKQGTGGGEGGSDTS